jgi:DNA-directed RNA polymerase II subunit RPB2
MNVVFPQIIKRNNPLVINTDYDAKSDAFKTIYEIKFGSESANDIYISKPIIRENTDTPKIMTPALARTRDYTYSGPMYIDVTHSIKKLNDNGNKYTTTVSAEEKKVFVGKIPIMLQSKYCHLSDKASMERAALGECCLDNGGYFIVNGSEKIVVAQERQCENRVYVFEPSKNPKDKFKLKAEIKSSLDQRFYPVKLNFVGLTVEPTLDKIGENLEKDKAIGQLFRVHIPQFGEDIPLFILFRALGITDDQTIYEIIFSNFKDCDNYISTLYYSAEDCREKNIYTQEAAYNYLAGKINNPFNSGGQNYETQRKQYVRKQIDSEFLPHLGVDMTKKAYFLGYMVRKLFDVSTGKRPYDKRDNYANKRLDLTGILMSQIVRSEWHTLTRNIRSEVLKHLVNCPDKLMTNLRKIIEKNNIEIKLVHCLATGNWGGQKSAADSTKKGVAQVLDRKSYPSTLSHRRRIVSPIAASGSKIVAPRRVDQTHYGMNCIDETPEGAQVGIVKNLALQCHVTIYTSDYQVRYALSKFAEYKPIVSVFPKDLHQYTKVFINGDLSGAVLEHNAFNVYNRLKVMKRHAIINPYISVAWYIEWNEIHIQTDGGRYMRPLFIVNPDDNRLQIAVKCATDAKYASDLRDGVIEWSQFVAGFFGSTGSPDLYNGGVVEYLDTTELENAMVGKSAYQVASSLSKSIYIRFTHCEINPMTQKGVIAQMIPFSNHNQSPRNCYQSSMGKQAIGYYATNYNSRLDTMAHILVYGQKAPCSTRTMKYTLMDQTPHGVACMLSYFPFEGYNQEDATIISRDAVQRGLFNTLFFRTYREIAQHHKATSVNSEIFKNGKKTEKVAELKHDNYDNIDDNGRPIEGRVVDEDQVIIGKLVELGKDHKSSEFKYKDASVVIKHNEGGIIDRTLPGSYYPFKGSRDINGDGHQFIKARVSALRQPEVGDKFATRHSQKGVTGLVADQINMPFTAQGIYPDIIMNPHGIPSRQTYAQVLETFMGKVCASRAELQDGTPFVERSIKDHYATLEAFGFNKFGNEVCYSGRTGKMYNAEIFIGPTYEQRLKHMVIDKVHSRDSGAVQLLTRQPAEGRSRGGGLRIGEMERDVFIAHGVQYFLKERMTDCSDKFTVFVSKEHKTIVTGNKEKGIYTFDGKNLPENDIVEIQIPYGMHLAIKELISMGIDIRLNADDEVSE